MVTLELPRWVASQVKDWKIELADNRGNWFTSPTVRGDLPIAIAQPSDLQVAASAQTIQLRFADNGNFDTATAGSIRGFDRLGQLVIESPLARR